MTIVRRCVGVALASAPVALILASMASDVRASSAPRLALLLAGSAMAIALFNIWLAFGRPRYLRWRNPAGKFPHVSLIPGIGTVLAVLASLLGSGMPGVSIVSLLAVVLDVGGFPWVVIWAWRNQSLWRPR